MNPAVKEKKIVAINYKSEQPVAKDYFSTEHLKTGLTGRALRGASLTMAGQLSSFIIHTGGTILLARLLTPDDFGLITMVLSFSLLLQGFGGNGFVEAAVQRKELDHKQMSTLFWINAGLSLLLMLLFIAAAPAIAMIFKEPRLKPIVVAMAASIFFGGLSNQHLSLIIRNMRFLDRTLLEVGSAFVSIAGAIVLAWWGWGYWALVMKWLLAPLMFTIGAWAMCDWRPGLPSRSAGVGPMLKFAFNTYGNFVMSYFRRNIDKMLIGRSFGTQSLGFYDRAYHLSTMLPTQIISPLNSVSLAAFSRLTDDHEKYRRTYLKVISILAFVGMPLSAALTLISNDVILLLLGPNWSEAGLIFRAFGPSIGVAIIYITHGWLHLSLGTPDRWFRWSIVEFIATAACFIIGLFFGPLGVAVAFSASFYILIGPALSYAGTPVSLTFSSILSALWKYYASALAAGILSWFLLYDFNFISGTFLQFSTIGRIVASSVLCMSVYLFIVVLAHGSLKPISDFLAIVREILSRKRSDR